MCCSVLVLCTNAAHVDDISGDSSCLLCGGAELQMLMYVPVNNQGAYLG